MGFGKFIWVLIQVLSSSLTILITHSTLFLVACSQDNSLSECSLFVQDVTHTKKDQTQVMTAKVLFVLFVFYYISVFLYVIYWFSQ